MRYALKVLLILAVFFGVGYGMMHLVIAHSTGNGTPAAELRLAGAMAGLFAGGAVAYVVWIAVFWWGRPRE